jgi:serine protease Do
MTQTEDIAAGVQAVVERAAASVVRIGRGRGRGAGFVLAEGFVATNAHNLRGPQVTVRFHDGRSVIGEVRGVDPDGDLAVVSVDTGGASALQWGAAPNSFGELVFVVTAATFGARATVGRVSALRAAFRSPRGRLIEDAVEHTAPLAPGSSGSPLLDGEGRVVGVNTHRPGEGFYLAVPASEPLRQRLDALAEGRSVQRARLGVAVAPPEVARRLRGAVGLPERDGLLVRGVEEGGPADRAGLRRGDLLIRAAAAPLTSSDDLFAALEGIGEGASLTLTVLRGEEEREVTVSFGDDASAGT